MNNGPMGSGSLLAALRVHPSPNLEKFFELHQRRGGSKLLQFLRGLFCKKTIRMKVRHKGYQIGGRLNSIAQFACTGNSSNKPIGATARFPLPNQDIERRRK
jgi:hypothetical protein